MKEKLFTLLALSFLLFSGNALGLPSKQNVSSLAKQ